MPEGNERDFMRMALHLGYESLICLYGSPQKRNDIQDMAGDEGMRVLIAALPKGKAIKRPAFADHLFAQGEKPRQFIERPGVSLVYDTESSHPRKFMHHRGSGLNQVLCRMAAEKETAIGFNLSRILMAKPVERSRLMGCMRQNIHLCRKYKVMMRLASFARNPFLMRAPHDVLSFGVSLGMHPAEAKASLTLSEQE